MNFIINSDVNDNVVMRKEFLIKENIDNITDILTSDKKTVLIVGRKTYEENTYLNLIKNNFEVIIFSHTTNYDDIINDYTKNKETKNYFVIGGISTYKTFERFVKKIYQTVFLTSTITNEIKLYTIPDYFQLIETSGIETNYTECIKFRCEIYKKNTYINIPNLNGEYQYLNILKRTLEADKRETRNAITRSYFGDQIRFNLQKGFPLLTTKKMAINAIIHELLFFIRGSSNTKELESVGVNIWKGNTNREFLDKNGHTDKQEGNMGPMYGVQWRRFNGELDQLTELLKELKDNPTSRRLLMTAYNPLQAKDGVLYPCHSIVNQFYVEEKDNKRYVSLMMYQRSADVFLGLPFNIASMSLFLTIICNYLTDDIEYIPKDVVISLGDVHLYEDHVNQAIEQLERIPLQFCEIEIKNKYKNIEDYKKEDIIIKNYKSYPPIKADMIA